MHLYIHICLSLCVCISQKNVEVFQARMCTVSDMPPIRVLL